MCKKLPACNWIIKDGAKLEAGLLVSCIGLYGARSLISASRGALLGFKEPSLTRACMSGVDSSGGIAQARLSCVGLVKMFNQFRLAFCREAP